MKLIGKASERDVSEIPGHNESEHIVSLVTQHNLKVELLELERRQKEETKRHETSQLFSGVLVMVQYQGHSKQLEKPSLSQEERSWSKVSFITGNKGKGPEGREGEG